MSEQMPFTGSRFFHVNAWHSSLAKSWHASPHSAKLFVNFWTRSLPAIYVFRKFQYGLLPIYVRISLLLGLKASAALSRETRSELTTASCSITPKVSSNSGMIFSESTNNFPFALFLNGSCSRSATVPLLLLMTPEIRVKTRHQSCELVS